MKTTLELPDPLFRKAEEVHRRLDSNQTPNEDSLNAKFRQEAFSVGKLLETEP